MGKSIAGYDEEEWKKLEKDFIENYETIQKFNTPFSELIQGILAGESKDAFSEKTGLRPEMLYELLNRVDEQRPIERKGLISICIGYNVGYYMAHLLMDSLGMGVNPKNKRDYAYDFLLTHCRGKSVEQCNEILQALGYEKEHLIGIYARRNREE